MNTPPTPPTASTTGRTTINEYTDLAIATMATVKSLFHLGGRQTEGFLESLFSLMGFTLKAPDHSTVSRRLGTGD